MAPNVNKSSGAISKSMKDVGGQLGAPPASKNTARTEMAVKCGLSHFPDKCTIPSKNEELVDGAVAPIIRLQTATKREAFLAGRKRIREYATAKAAMRSIKIAGIRECAPYSASLGSRPAAARACIASTVVGATSTGENVLGALSGECRSSFGRSFLNLYRDVGEIAGQIRAIS